MDLLPLPQISQIYPEARVRLMRLELRTDDKLHRAGGSLLISHTGYNYHCTRSSI